VLAIRDGVRAAALWLLASMLGWGAVLAFEAQRAETWRGALGQLAYLSGLCVWQASAFGGALLALHGLRVAAERKWQRGDRVSTALSAAVALGPAWSQATFLTSGSEISEHAQVGELRVLFCALLTGGYAALWRWHSAGVRSRAPRAVTRRERLARGTWYAGGLGALCGLVYLIHYELKAYAFFAQFLVVPSWLLASTLVARPLLRLPLSAKSALWTLSGLCAAVLLLELGAAPHVARARGKHLRRGKIAALSDLWVYPTEGALSNLDIADTEHVECTPHPRYRTRPAPAIPAEKRRNVLIVSVDALRRDALQWRTPEGQPLLPALRAFAQQSVRFERAVTTYPATLIAMGGALTGLDASQLLFAPRVPKNLFALTRGRFESMIVSMPESRWFQKPVVRELLLKGAKGAAHANAAKQTDWIINRLRKARARTAKTLLWAHYYEPHHPYVKHRRFEYGEGERERYMSEIAYVDAQLARLFAYLKESGSYEDTLVLVFSDHGEAMGELDYFGHHVYLNAWITDIPLLMRAPGVAPRASYELTDITDVAATVLHFVDAPIPWDAVGTSLLALDSERRGRVSFAEAFPIRGSQLFQVADEQVKSLRAFRARMQQIHRGAKDYLPKVSVVSAEHRLIVNRVTGLEELYDRRKDPREEHDLSSASLHEQKVLRARLQAWSSQQAELLYCKVLAASRKKAKRPAQPAPAQPAPAQPAPAPTP
jgi:arylsulfatase A-like enzyme